MPRLTTVDDVCFPVAECPVSTTLEGPMGTLRLSVPHSKALVNAQTGRVLGIVSRTYRLVTNKEALAWARECCRQVFPDTKDVEWRVDVTDAPASGGHCSIDLVHPSAGLSFVDVCPGATPEVFGPFIRVTNSYNGLRALAFNIGFHRKVCSNGLIAPDTIIQYRFAHRKRDLGKGVRFEVAHDLLENLQEKFRAYITALAERPVPRVLFERLVGAVLLRGSPRSLRPESPEAVEWSKLQGHLSRLSDQYARELGDNAYAVLNTMTDFATRPPENRHLHRDRHSLQRLAGRWLSDFTEISRKPEFGLVDYLAELEKEAQKAGAEDTRLASRPRILASV